MKSYFVLLVMTVLAITLMVACGTKTETQLVEVTRLVQEPVTQIVTVEVERSGAVAPPVEVTRLVEVTRIVEVEKEVTRQVVVEPTATPTPQGVDTSAQFSVNYAGSLEQDGIKIEIARVMFEKKPSSFNDNDNFTNQDYVGEIIWRITNNTQKKISWNSGQLNVRVNNNQISLSDYIFDAFNESPIDPIFPGSTIIGGVYFGIGSVKLDDIVSFALLMESPYDADTYRGVSGNFIITVDLSGKHEWYPLPDELK